MFDFSQLAAFYDVSLVGIVSIAVAVVVFRSHLEKRRIKRRLKAIDEKSADEQQLGSEPKQEQSKNNHSRRPVVLFGKYYDSISEAISETYYSRPQIRAFLESTDRPDCYYATISWHSVRPPGPRPTPVVINRVRYESVAQAASELKIAMSTLRDRLNSRNFENYRYCDGRKKRGNAN